MSLVSFIRTKKDQVGLVHDLRWYVVVVVVQVL